jgi:hypothetical protein
MQLVYHGHTGAFLLFSLHPVTAGGGQAYSEVNECNDFGCDMLK